MTLRLLTLSDWRAAVEIQSTAFRNDPLWQYLVPDLRRRDILLRSLFGPVLRFSILNGQAVGTGEPLGGIAVWSAPGQKTRLSAVLRSGFPRLLFNPTFLAAVPGFIRGSLPIFSRFEEMQKHYAPEPHYYLQTISVSPAAQGQGLASKLIRPFLDRADREGVSTYTETMTPSNVGLYEHYGFRTVEAYRFPETDLMLWGFYRPVPNAVRMEESPLHHHTS